MEQRRTIVGTILPTAGSERRACRWLGVHRSAVRYVPDHRDEAALRSKLRDLAEANPRWGAPMLTWKLRQEGILDNHKRTPTLSAQHVHRGLQWPAPRRVPEPALVPLARRCAANHRAVADWL